MIECVVCMLFFIDVHFLTFNCLQFLRIKLIYIWFKITTVGPDLKVIYLTI